LKVLKNNSLSINRRNSQSVIRRLFAVQEVGILIPLIVMIIAFSFINSGFYSLPNVFSVLKTLAFYGIVAVGVTLIIIGGDIDISVGSTAGFGAVFSAFIMMQFQCFGMWGTPNEWIGVIICMIITLAVCSIVGFANAYLIVDVKLPAFIATIATLYIVRGAVMVVTNGNPIYPLPSFFMDGIGQWQIPITKVGENTIGISLPIIVFIVLVVIFEYMLRRTRWGRNIYATGSNREVAKLSGINTRRVRYTNFVITAILASLSGMLVAAFTRQGYPPIGTGWELQIIAATAVGGITMTGGAGSMIGTLIGVLIMNIVNNGLVMMNIDTFVQQAVQGVIIILAVSVDIMRRNQKVHV
jgi:ribose transport system permease protein